MIEFIIPVRTVSESNIHAHWTKRAARAAMQRETSYLVTKTHKHISSRPPATVLLVRVGRNLLDSDNLQGSLKAVRDGIAQVWGCGDAPSGPIVWAYDQMIGHEYGVLVKMEWREKICG